MKKLLGILVLGLLFCSTVNASIIEIEKCYINKTISDYVSYSSEHEFDKEWKQKSWEEAQWYPIDEELNSAKIAGQEMLAIEKHAFSIDGQNGIVTQIQTYSDEWLDDAKVRHDKQMKKEGVKLPMYFSKYMTKEFNIINYATKVIFASKIRHIEKSILHTLSPDDWPTKNEQTLSIDLDKFSVEWKIKKFFKDKNYAEEITTHRILCQSKDTEIAGEGGTSGTAFFISNKGYLLTNSHVVEGCKVSKINYLNKEYDTELIASDKTLDLALLKAKVKPKSFISFSKNEPKKRQTITAAGYPLGKFLSDDLKINDGRISALKGFENNSNEIQHDIPINPGNSGGPIVNEKGQLVAIAVSGMAKDITEGLNFGIKSSAAANFLKSNKISPSAGYMSFSMNDDKLVKLLEESTVYTFCE